MWSLVLLLVFLFNSFTLLYSYPSLYYLSITQSKHHGSHDYSNQRSPSIASKFIFPPPPHFVPPRFPPPPPPPPSSFYFYSPPPPSSFYFYSPPPPSSFYFYSPPPPSSFYFYSPPPPSPRPPCAPKHSQPLHTPPPPRHRLSWLSNTQSREWFMM